MDPGVEEELAVKQSAGVGHDIYNGMAVVIPLRTMLPGPDDKALAFQARNSGFDSRRKLHAPLFQ
jgi:hypothetical protein